MNENDKILLEIKKLYRLLQKLAEELDFQYYENSYAEEILIQRLKIQEIKYS